MRRLLRQRAGFTLLEAILVAAIILIVVGAVSASMSGFLSRSRFQATVGRVTTMAVFARSRALSSGNRVLMRINIDSNRIGLFETPPAADSELRPLGARWQVALPEVVAISQLEIAGENTREGDITFFPDGGAQEAHFSLVLLGDSPDAETRDFWINKTTGRVQVE